MQYTKDSRIATIDDVKEFFSHLVRDCQIAFHPDERFENYVSIENGHNTFSQAECDIYNRLMDDSFEVCKNNGADIYDLGTEIIQKSMPNEEGRKDSL